MLRGSHRKHQRGLSIVELMVGVAIGLLIVAAAAMVVSGQLGENRRLLLETQVQQDLRAASDIVARELRRAGAWHEAQTSGVWSTQAPAACNRYATVTSSAGTLGFVNFRYYRDATNHGPIGFKVENGVLRAAEHLSASVDASVCEQTETPSRWQDLTDGRTLKITRFQITPTEAVQALPCARLCVDGSTDCWPRLVVRSFRIDIGGEAVSDPLVTRAMTAVVRVRNDLVRNQPATSTQGCPA